MNKTMVCPAVLILCLLTTACTNAPGGGSGAPSLETDEQKTLYALGILVGQNVEPFALTPEELEIVKAGFGDAVSDAEPKVEMATYGPKVNELAASRSAAGADEEKKKGQEFADAVAKEPGATKTESGIVIRTIAPGSGANPDPNAIVTVHYEGKLIDGTVFDSSVERGEPAEFPLANVVPCWREGVQKLKKGEKAQIVCPSDLAYGDRGAPPDIPPGATLSFEVELLDFQTP